MNAAGLAWLLLCCRCCWGHVALTFPPARTYPLDFLDNIRTPGPCGMPQGEKRTNIVAGSTFNVTWHLAYPHRGGYRLQLLTYDGDHWMDLTSSNDPKSFLRHDVTAQEHQVHIPLNVSCKGCSIRLEREATEWPNNYTFWSCADVNIVHEDEYKEDCFGNGVLKNGICICKKLYSGPRCQYKDECWENEDCGPNGKCVNIKATTFPQKQCYCQLGWFGEKCSKASVIDNTNIDLSQHRSYDLANDFKLHWKLIPTLGEIEIVAKVKSTTYVGLGWRPKGITSNCKAFPMIDDLISSESTVEGVGEAEPEPEPLPEPATSFRPAPKPINKEDRSRSITENTTFIEVELTADNVAAFSEPQTEPSSRNDTVDSHTFGSTSKESVATDGPKIREEFTEAAVATDSPKIREEFIEAVVATVGPKVKEELTEAAAESNRHPVTLEVSAHQSPSDHSNPIDHSYFDEPQQSEVNYGSEQQVNDGLVEYVHEPETTTTIHQSSISSRLKRAVVAHLTNHNNNETLINSDEVQVTPEPSSEPHTAANDINRQSKAVYSFSSTPFSEPEPAAETGPSAEPTSQSEAMESQLKVYKSSPYTPKADFHAMDCTDLVIGTAYGNFSRVFDYYTRDRSTPRVDNFWGGTDSLTAAAGFEKDGYTTIIFRRKLKATEDTDHSFTKSPMHVIWAKGQEPGAYSHNPLSGLETGKPTIPDFYRKDELKYHGHGSQRGVAEINFLANLPDKLVDESKGEWKTPVTCTIDDCEYRATWEYLSSQDLILFTISTNNSNKWTGIGFSDNTQMPNTDAILGWVDDAGRTFVMDVWIDKYGPPILDITQNVEVIKGSKTNGRVSLSFTRKRNTGDSEQDLSFTDSSCLYMMFPYDGGVFNAVNKKIRKHSSQPIVSSSRICIRGTDVQHSDGVDVNGVQSLAEVLPTLPTSGVQSTMATTSPTVEPKPSQAYMVSIRLPNQTLDDAVERGIDFKMLIREGLNVYISNALGQIKGFKKVEVTALESERNETHVLAKMRVDIDSSHEQKEIPNNFINTTVDQLSKTLNATISDGKVGRLVVDPSYLVIEPPEVPEPVIENVTTPDIRPSGDGNKNTLMYVIIAAVAALGFLFLLQITCMLSRCYSDRRSNISKENLIVGSAGWKDYASGASPTNGSTYGYSAYNEETPKLGKNPLSPAGGTSRSGHKNGQSRSSLDPNRPGETRSLNRNPRGGLSLDPNQSNYSRRSETLPRLSASSDSHEANDRVARPSSASGMYPHGGLQPDFYFMPSQRRYSGEVVRVFVDYNNPNYTGK